MQQKKNSGFTLMELLVSITFLSFWGVVCFVVAHFIMKYW